MSAVNTRILLVVSALVLSVLLYFVPRSLPAQAAGKKTPVAAQVSTQTLEVFLGMAYKSLEPLQKQQAEKWQAQNAFDSLVNFWTSKKRPDFAAHFSEQKARELKTAAQWLEAGNRYYYAVQFIQDQNEIPALYQCAMRCFQNAVSLNPSDSEARIMLASCYVEGSNDQMKGISLLREVEKTDSNNVRLQLAFALFSEQSGQLDKAIARFNKVLRADSTYIEAYLHLADDYKQLGDIPKTIEMLEKYASRTSDATSKLEVAKYINQLKNNIN